MPASRATRATAGSPTIENTAEAASLSEVWIIGYSSELSKESRLRCCASSICRYATSIITLTTLAVSKCSWSRTPLTRPMLSTTASEVRPARVSRKRSAAAMDPAEGWAGSGMPRPCPPSSSAFAVGAPQAASSAHTSVTTAPPRDRRLPLAATAGMQDEVVVRTAAGRARRSHRLFPRRVQADAVGEAARGRVDHGVRVEQPRRQLARGRDRREAVHARAPRLHVPPRLRRARGAQQRVADADAQHGLPRAEAAGGGGHAGIDDRRDRRARDGGPRFQHDAQARVAIGVDARE